MDEVWVRFPSPPIDGTEETVGVWCNGSTRKTFRHFCRRGFFVTHNFWEHDGECPVKLHRNRSARQLAPGERKLGCFTPFCRRRLESVANAVGTTCRGFESHQLHFPPMNNRKTFGAVAQRVEQYRFTILVATIWKDRPEGGTTNRKRTRAECSPGLHLPMLRLGKNTCRLFLKLEIPRRMLVRSTWFCEFDSRLEVSASWLRDSDRTCRRFSLNSDWRTKFYGPL